MSSAWGRPCQQPLRCQSAVKHGHRINYPDALGLQFCSYSTQNTIIAKASKPRQHRYRPVIRSEGISQPQSSNAAGHCGLGYARFPEHIEKALELADLNPRNGIGDVGQARIRFSDMSNCDGS